MKDLPNGAAYEVVEDEEDYKKTDGTEKAAGYEYNGKFYETESAAKAAADEDQGAASGAGDYSGITEKKHNDAASGTLTQNVFTGFTNTRNGVIPTGVAVGAIGAVVLVAVAAIYFGLRKKMSAYEED